MRLAGVHTTRRPGAHRNAARRCRSAVTWRNCRTMALAKTAPTQDLEIRAPIRPGYERILSPEALAFIAGLERKFGGERRRLLAARAERQTRLDRGWKPDLLPETRKVRESDW